MCVRFVREQPMGVCACGHLNRFAAFHAESREGLMEVFFVAQFGQDAEARPLRHPSVPSDNRIGDEKD